MSKTKSLEEGWEAFRFAQIHEGPALRDRETAKAARAPALAVLEEARAIDEAPTMARAGLYEKQQRRIEELGR